MAVQVAEGRVVRRGREHARGQLVVEGARRLPLAAAAPPAQQRDVRHDHVDRVRGEALGQQRDELRHPAGVVQGVLGGLVQQHLGGADRVPVRQERQRGHPQVLAAPGAQPQRPARVRSLRRAEHVQSELAEHRPVHRVDEALVVVVACDGHDQPAVLAQRHQRAHDQPLGLRVRRRSLEQVARHQHDVDILVARGAHDAAERRDVLVVPIAPLEDLADVPVAGVQDPHTRLPVGSAVCSTTRA